MIYPDEYALGKQNGYSKACEDIIKALNNQYPFVEDLIRKLQEGKQ